MDLALALRYAASCVHGGEGFRAVAYLDTLPRVPVWTIGHGTTRIENRPVREGMTCTRDQADAWAAADMNAAACYILRHVSASLNEWQLAALTSFCYNVGMGAFEGSNVRAALNAHQPRLAADRLLDYNHAGGRVIAGLTARRVRERALFLIGLGDPPDSHPIVAPLHQPAIPVASDPDTSSDALNDAELARQKAADARAALDTSSDALNDAELHRQQTIDHPSAHP